MANSNRKVILTHIAETVLPTITIANGFNFNVATFARGLVSLEELTDEDYPALFVSSADETREDVTHKDFKSLMLVRIHGFVKAAADDVQKQLDDLIEDVTEALYADPTQGGRVNWTKVKTIETDEGNLEGHAIFRLTVEFLYKSPGKTA